MLPNPLIYNPDPLSYNHSINRRQQVQYSVALAKDTYKSRRGKTIYFVLFTLASSARFLVLLKANKLII